jgi:hypothetical protein
MDTSVRVDGGSHNMKETTIDAETIHKRASPPARQQVHEIRVHCGQARSLLRVVAMSYGCRIALSEKVCESSGRT